DGHRAARADGLHRVVDEVEHGAFDVVGIDLQQRHIVGMAGDDRALWVRLAVERGHGGPERARVGWAWAESGHPREAGELVNETLEAVDLLDDRLRALRHQLRVLAADAREPAPQPLRGELDRRQRVLDLVRDALRDLAPRGQPLRLEQLGEI